MSDRLEEIKRWLEQVQTYDTFDIPLRPSQKTRKHLLWLISELEKCRAENKELNDMFDFQIERMNEADKLWQAATGKFHTSPDLGVLLEWLMAEIKRLNAILANKGINGG